MYSYEIQQILESNNFSIPSDTYMNICSASPQITRINYNLYGHYFEIWQVMGIGNLVCTERKNKLCLHILK